MANEAHIRIDEGIKRPDKRKMRQEARKSLKSANGENLRMTRQYTPEMRSQAILAVPDAILSGKTPKDVALAQGIPISTLYSWILGNENVETARAVLIAYELAAKTEGIDTANDALELARAREGFRAWSWIAERRESRLYGQKQEVTVGVDVRIEVDHQLQEAARELISRVRAVALIPTVPHAALLSPETVIDQTDDTKQ